MSRFFDGLLQLIFPEQCAVCGKASGGGTLCENCLPKLQRLPQARVPRVPDSSLVEIVAAFEYRGPGGRLMREFKNSRRFRCYEQYLRGPFEASVAGFYSETRFDLVIPVPLYRPDESKRGFNQAEYIARRLAKPVGARCLCVLRKELPGEKQHYLPSALRAENVRGAYAAKKGLDLTGKRVLLVDDICTTGATMEECASVLLRSGAASVYGAAVLHSQKWRNSANIQKIPVESLG